MRKLIASSVLLLMLAIFFAPAFANTPSSSLPACCRRGGAHHCEAVAQVVVPGAISLRSANRCPLWHGSLLVSSIAALPVSHSFASRVRHEALARCALSTAYFSIVRSDYQRGPPELL